jgi:outer membrane protein assembly factor BamB
MKAKRVATTKAVLVVLTMLAGAGASYANWPTAHGTAGNTGFARVDTLAAKFPTGFADVGQVAPGANPVTATDGTLYIGNLAGEVIALHPDGKPYWNRKLNREHGVVFASPAVGADGSLYVVSNASFRDHANAGDKGVLHAVFLHKFTPSGGLIFSFPFPKSTLYPFTDLGASTAPPNIWRFNGTEAIMVPVFYKGTGKTEVRVIAFSTGGAVIGDQRVTIQTHEITQTNGLLGDVLDFIIDHFNYRYPVARPSLPDAGWPQPGVAIWEYPQGSPYIWLADGIRSTVAYKFDPSKGFSEIYRFSDAKDRLSSPPIALDNVVAAVGTSDGVLKFERANFSVPGWGDITAAPTRMFDGRLAVVARFGKLFLMKGYAVALQQPLDGDSIASAAASCTHLFVSSDNELVTFDVKTMSPVARVPWTEGGRHAPIIGPLGHVYAMTNFGLFVFSAPPKPAFPVLTASAAPRTACDQLVSTTGGGLIAP